MWGTILDAFLFQKSVKDHDSVSIISSNINKNYLKCRLTLRSGENFDSEMFFYFFI